MNEPAINRVTHTHKKNTPEWMECGIVNECSFSIRFACWITQNVRYTLTRSQKSTQFSGIRYETLYEIIESVIFQLGKKRGGKILSLSFDINVQLTPTRFGCGSRESLLSPEPN